MCEKGSLRWIERVFHAEVNERRRHSSTEALGVPLELRLRIVQVVDPEFMSPYSRRPCGLYTIPASMGRTLFHVSSTTNIEHCTLSIVHCPLFI